MQLWSRALPGEDAGSLGARSCVSAPGGYGAGWEASWGSFEDYAREGLTAVAACCGCGGGLRNAPGAAQPTARVDGSAAGEGVKPGRLGLLRIGHRASVLLGKQVLHFGVSAKVTARRASCLAVTQLIGTY